MENRRLLESTPELLSLLKAVLGEPTGKVTWSLEPAATARKTGMQSFGANIKTVRDTALDRKTSVEPVPVAERKAATKRASVEAKQKAGSGASALREKLSSSVHSFLGAVLWDGSGALNTTQTAIAPEEVHQLTGGTAFQEAYGKRALSASVRSFFGGVTWDGSGAFVAPSAPVLRAVQSPPRQKHVTENLSLLTLEPVVEAKSAQSLFSDFGND